MSIEAYTRVADLWFPDGTIVLAAADGQKLFRVYWGTLASRSNVFGGMFTIPQPGEGEISIEGTPVIFMHDKAVELQRFLAVLFNPLLIMQGNGKDLADDIRMSTAVLRLSTKYEVQQLRDRALSNLAIYFPNTYKEMTDSCVKQQEYVDRCGNAAEIDRLCAEVLGVALETQATVLLPSACYMCISNGLEAFIGTETTLHPEILRICVRAIPKLLQAQANSMFQFLLTPTPCTTHGSSCAQKHGEYTELFTSFLLRPCLIVRFGHALDIPLEAFCTSCAGRILSNLSHGQKDVWKHLPDVFDLPDWPTLRKQFSSDS